MKNIGISHPIWLSPSPYPAVSHVKIMQHIGRTDIWTITQGFQGTCMADKHNIITLWMMRPNLDHCVSMFWSGTEKSISKPCPMREFMSGIMLRSRTHCFALVQNIWINLPFCDVARAAIVGWLLITCSVAFFLDLTVCLTWVRFARFLYNIHNLFDEFYLIILCFIL